MLAACLAHLRQQQQQQQHDSMTTTHIHGAS